MYTVGLKRRIQCQSWHSNVFKKLSNTQLEYLRGVKSRTLQKYISIIQYSEHKVRECYAAQF